MTNSSTWQRNGEGPMTEQAKAQKPQVSERSEEIAGFRMKPEVRTPPHGTTGLSLIPFIRSASFEQSSVKMNFRLRTEPELAERLSLSTG